MAGRKGSSEGGGGLFIALVLVIWFVTTFFWWIVAGLAAVVAFYVGRAILRWHRQQQALHAAFCAAVAARADQQHNWVLQGDERGIYGPEGAKLMRYIRG